MAAYRWISDSRHLQADCQEPGSAPESYARQSSMGYLFAVLKKKRWEGFAEKEGLFLISDLSTLDKDCTRALQLTQNFQTCSSNIDHTFAEMQLIIILRRNNNVFVA